MTAVEALRALRQRWWILLVAAVYLAKGVKAPKPASAPAPAPAPAELQQT